MSRIIIAQAGRSPLEVEQSAYDAGFFPGWAYVGPAPTGSPTGYDTYMDAAVAAVVGSSSSSTSGALRAAYGAKVNLPTGCQAITYPDHLNRFRAKLATAQFQPVNITCIGNSITYGYYANSLGTVDEVAFRARGWVTQLRNLFASKYGATGEGVIAMADPRVTSSGASTIGSVGITQYGGGKRLTNTGQSVTLTLSADSPATEIWVHGWWESNAKCSTPQVQVDGGAVTNMTGISALGSDIDWTYKITGLSSGTHTVVITALAATQIDLAGFSIFNTTSSKGVNVHRLGQGGGYVDTVFYPTSNSGANPRSDRLTLGRPQTDLLVLGFGANEASTTGQGVGWSPTGQGAKNYHDVLTDVVTYATGTYGCDVLLASFQRQNPSQVSTYGEQAFYDVHESIAAGNSRVAHWDLSRALGWDSYATASGRSYMQDNVHGNLTMHSDAGRMLFQALDGL